MMISLRTLAIDLWPEHPRPDLYRENWLSLNGERQFEIWRARILLTDIKQEKSRLFYYDRKLKFEVKKLHEITSRQAA